jgi:hypothetical protein
MKFQKPCLICGELSTENRCPIHLKEYQDAEKARQDGRKRGRTLYTSPAYRKQAAYFRDYATACHLCGKGKIINDPFTADHLVPGDPQSALLPAHRSCNSKRGNKPLP